MKRFFSETSFWNLPIGDHPTIDPASDALVQFMKQKDDRGFWLNLDRWTIPIYDVDSSTPRRRVYKRFQSDSNNADSMLGRSASRLGANHPYGHGADFAEDAGAGRIPIPEYAIPDPEPDSHMALVDWEAGWIWDMWAVKKRADGEWESRTGMKYRLDGSGVFSREDFPVQNGESIHLYGPSRAAGVPALAGTIMHREIQEGRIGHKLGFATMAAALQKFVSPPAAWTDGGWRNGLPEGAVLQLDPALDLSRFGLSRGWLIIAKALQEYGAVCVDVAAGHTLYGEGLYGDPGKRNWDGMLKSEHLKIGLEHFRVLSMENIVAEGMGPRKPDGVYAGEE